VKRTIAIGFLALLALAIVGVAGAERIKGTDGPDQLTGKLGS